MSDRRRQAIQGLVLVAIVLSPFLLLEVLPVVAGVVPGWLVRFICIGFFCSFTILLLLVPVLLLTGWGIAELSDRGYLPGN